MRRHAEIAHHAVDGAWHALLAARNAAREALQTAAALTIDPGDAGAIREAARRHLERIEQAVHALEPARISARALDETVDRAEISRFGLAVLPARAGA